MKTGWYIGRFQPFHNGHQTMIEKILEECGKCVVLVRDVSQDDNNPYDSDAVKQSIHEWAERNDLYDVYVIIVPDYDADMTVYYGRGVGWDFKELKLPKEIEDISATKIRKEIEDISA